MKYSLPCECRLCDWASDGWAALGEHLNLVHELPDALGDELTMRLHAAKDYPDRSENTMGCYNPDDRLIAVIVRILPRAADDPMGFSELP